MSDVPSFWNQVVFVSPEILTDLPGLAPGSVVLYTSEFQTRLFSTDLRKSFRDIDFLCNKSGMASDTLARGWVNDVPAQRMRPRKLNSSSVTVDGSAMKAKQAI